MNDFGMRDGCAEAAISGKRLHFCVFGHEFLYNGTRFASHFCTTVALLCVHGRGRVGTALGWS